MTLPFRFYTDLAEIEKRRDNAVFDEDTGLPVETLTERCLAVAAQSGKSRTILKAEILACLFDNARLEISPCDLFADRIDHGNIVLTVRQQWKEVYARHNGDYLRETAAANAHGAWSGDDDFGHTCPDWENLMSRGLPGVLADLKDAQKAHPENDLYRAGVIVYSAMIRLADRFADAADRYAAAYPTAALTAANLRELARHEPRTLYQAMQLTLLIFRLQGFVEGEAVRSLGRLDKLYAPFATDDGDETDELLRYCFCRLYVKSFTANIPFTLGGEDVADDPAVTAMTLRMLRILCELHNPSPKVQLRIGRGTSRDVILTALSMIRAGTGSIVFCNDDTVEAALIRNGHKPDDARNYVMIGCYESSVMGHEAACTCCGRVSLPKAVECALNRGRDLRDGTALGPDTGEDFASFAGFLAAVKEQAAHFARQSMARTVCMERDYMEVNPSPILSGAMRDCLACGRDVYEGGARYNFSSVNIFGTATAADAAAAVRALVFDEKRLTIPELREILRSDWADHDELLEYCRNRLPKYGCGDAATDAIAADLLSSTAAVVNGTPNGRGGLFRAGAFSIDWRYEYGRKTAATPDGRRAGEPLSKNMCASEGADRRGVTAHILSACGFDYGALSNGTVLDLVLHSSAVQGGEGLDAMEGLLRAFLRRGGLAIQFNVLDEEMLRDAQRRPEAYSTLQIRICGWNALFVDLSRAEQDEFIRRTEAAR